jgi:hypothetical protein
LRLRNAMGDRQDGGGFRRGGRGGGGGGHHGGGGGGGGGFHKRPREVCARALAQNASERR